MSGVQFRAQTPLRIRFIARLYRWNQCALRWNNDSEDITYHKCTNDGAKVDKCPSTAKQISQEIDQENASERENNGYKRDIIFEPAPAQELIKYIAQKY